jgi:hypothetical protein
MKELPTEQYTQADALPVIQDVQLVVSVAETVIPLPYLVIY